MKIDKEKESINKQAEENKYLDSIQDMFQKTYLKTQYELANDINTAFEELRGVKLNDEFTSSGVKKDVQGWQKKAENLGMTLNMRRTILQTLLRK